MHYPATAEIWQTASGKDFGGMAQGCNNTGHKDTNAMFVMMHDKIYHALAAFFLLTQIQLLITALRRTIPIKVESQLN
jgi:hypothetical protein